MKVVLVLTVITALFYNGRCQVYSCPPVSPDTVGICSEECSSDGECEGLMKCCSNGCGHMCTHPTTIPYHAPPYTCPALDNNTAGICAEECGPQGECPTGGQCCSNGCGHTCQGVCHLITAHLSNQTLIGAYTPQCEDDGSFTPVQFHGSTGYSWCVDPSTGSPLSELSIGQLECSCSYNGDTHTVGNVFRHTDGFNTCTCTVNGVQCTEDKVFYSCPAIREDEEAGICVAECTLDSECSSHTKCCYTGCGYSCMSPVVTPYIPVPISDTCPPSNQVPCALTQGSCPSDHLCDSTTSLCCPNDCGSSLCVYRTGPEPCRLARRIAAQRNASRDTTVGRFSPQCDPDGHFKSVQCQEHFCWCVNTLTGEPTTDNVAFEHLDQLPCTECVYEGRKYGFLESFPAADGCNTCTCVYEGAFSCTEIGCVGPTEAGDLWDWWHHVLIYSVVAVVVLTCLVLVLLVTVVITMKRNSFRHRKLKEDTAVHFESEMDAVYFKPGQELGTVELKVPGEDHQA